MLIASADVTVFVSNHAMELLATVLFVLAVLHTFLVGWFKKLAHHYPEGSMGENLFHLLGETEAVFLFWAGALITGLSTLGGWHNAIAYVDQLNFTEPKFVFVIMVMAATRPVIAVVETAIGLVAKMLPLPSTLAFLLAALVVGPLLGSFVTEPAAMTVTAMVLYRQFFDRELSLACKYAILATLFVNVSIGGVLTNFAAPPVLMVAGTWGWSSSFMFLNFGWKAMVAVGCNAAILCSIFRKEICNLNLLENQQTTAMNPPWWAKVVHLGMMGIVVVTAHHPDFFTGIFVFFLAFCVVTREFQTELKVKEALLVGGFLSGLVTLGGLQSWWLQPLLARLGEFPLFAGATALTAVTDNAALTFLGAQVPNLPDAMKYALVAGAVTGGGLTVIANAPNPAGQSIVSETFPGGVNPISLLKWALLPTAVAFASFWLL